MRNNVEMNEEIRVVNVKLRLTMVGRGANVKLK